VLAAVLIGAGVLWGLVPGLADAAATGAARFTDTAGYAAAVLHGAQTHVSAHAPAHGLAPFLYGLAGCVVAVIVGMQRVGHALPRAIGAVRDLHSGRAGDYLAWLAAGAAVLAAACALSLTG
jgi:multicomponent Na+:H+ antiporter subunit D